MGTTIPAPPDASTWAQDMTRAGEQDADLIAKLVKIRRSKGLTQLQVAERMECSQQSVSKFEQSGGDPRLSTIRRYALAIEVSLAHHVE